MLYNFLNIIFKHFGMIFFETSSKVIRCFFEHSSYFLRTIFESSSNRLRIWNYQCNFIIILYCFI